jgi:tRNA A-37 threonylcarbamoyl transferase component Bud32/dienelactone hydrolase
MTDALQGLWDSLADRYAVEREIGHGGMATVYLARDIKHGRAVAIKVLRPELAQAVGGERFLREINIAAQLQSPHILPLLDSGAAGGLLFYVMPYVEGDSLRGRLVREGALPPSEAMRLFHDIVDAVAHAHRHGVVHRDLKPDNVMIAERHALVVDFGVAKAMRDATAHHDLTSIGISLGTPAYMAPEQAAADPGTDHRADIYALGVMAYEMLNGKPPFTGAPQAVLAAQITTAPPPLLEARPEVPPAIAQLVMKCLEKDPARRYQTADDLLLAVESLQTPAPAPIGAPPPAANRARRAALTGAGLVAVAALAFFGTARLRRDRWVHETALPELRRLVEAAEFDSAFALALRIDEATPGDTALKKLWPRFSRLSVITTDPPGAKVYRAAFPDTSNWRYIGTTPTDSVRLPSRVGLFRIEKPGFRTLLKLGGSRPELALLDSISAPHPEMVRIAGGEFRAFLVGSDNANPLKLGAFRLDRYEVSNRQYKAFVDAGGYRERKFWDQPFKDGDRSLSWDEAMARFSDKTGRPGPATWEGGDFPSGQGDFPAGGVSWYEAAAYAKFAGKALPTIYHWAHAATVGHSRFVVPLSNLDGKGLLAVGTPRGVTLGGVSDMAGNVREWCANDASQGQRYILGGGWSDQTYAFVDAYAAPPMDRSAINGIRLALFDAGDPNLARASQTVPRAFTDYSKETPVSDAVFAGYRQQFDYDPIPLDARVEARDTTPDDWNLERVSFSAAYGGERLSAWLFLPKRGKGPFQTVVYFPGSGVIFQRSSATAREAAASFVVRTGRVFVLPIYKSTYERGDSLNSDIANESIFWRDHVVMWGKDYRRTLDYLSTRADIDTTKFAYFGVSWGGYMGGIIPAIEPRLKAAVLYVAGLTMERGRPEVEPINFLPRIRIPVIMLNGKYDFFFPVATAQEPFFRFLGSPPSDKRYLVYEGGHDVPRTELIKETLAWLDKYLGPVR